MSFRKSVTRLETRTPRELLSGELLNVRGAGGSPWEIGGGLNMGSNRQPSGTIDLSYQFPRGTVTGSVTSQGHGLETGLGYQGRVGNNGKFEGTFSTNGHDWNSSVAYRHRF